MCVFYDVNMISTEFRYDCVHLMRITDHIGGVVLCSSPLDGNAEGEAAMSAPGQPDLLLWLHSYYDIIHHLIIVEENIYSTRYFLLKELLLSSGNNVEISEVRWSSLR